LKGLSKKCSIYNLKNIQKIIILSKKYHNKITNVLWLFLEKFFLLAVEILVISLVAKHLGAEDYGVYNYVISVVAILSPFSVFGLSGVLVRYCIDSKNLELSNIISSAIFLRFIGSVLVVILVIFFIFFSALQSEIALYLILLALSELFKCLTAVASWFEANLLNRITAKVKISVVSISAVLKLF